MKNPYKLFIATGVRVKREHKSPMPESVCASANNASIVMFLVALTFFLTMGGAAKSQQDQASGSVIFKDSGSTNSQGYSLIINPDGSGHLEMTGAKRSPFSNLSSSKDFPSGLFNYAELKQAIECTPNLTALVTNCAKSDSFGSTLKLTYNNITSSDLTCLSGPEIETLSRVIGKITNEANCFGFNDQGCQNFKEIQTTGIDSGIAGTTYAFEVNGGYIKELKPIYAKLKLFKRDGSFIKEIETNSNFYFFVLLPPGDYFVTDEWAGLSHKPIGFFDGNNWRITTKTENGHGQYITSFTEKPFPDDAGEYPDRVEFTVTQHHINPLALYFDGYSLENNLN